jgi:EmrB/QacA subfamily drug resistance transporter
VRTAAPGERRGAGLTLAGLITAALAYAIMQTFLIPALPHLQRDLGTSQEWVTWTVTAYLLTGAVATPLISRLGDQHGKVRLMLISLGVFLVGSVGAIVAWNIGSLIAFRAVQGVGGAIFPLSFAIIRDEFPRERMSMAMGLVSAVLGVGGGVGIALSGLVVDHLQWRWLFGLSAIIVALALILVWRFVPESPVRAPASVDVPGAVLLSGGLVALLLAFTEGQSWGWASGPILGLFAAAAILLIAWILVEMRVPQPMVDMRMMSRRPVFFTNLTAMLSGFALYMTWVILPNFFQLPNGLPDSLRPQADYGFGTSVTMAGVWILPTSAAVLFGGPVAGLIGRRRGSRGPLVAGMILLGLGAAGIALWHEEPWQVALAFSVCGWGIGFAFAAMPKLIADAVDPSETGVANGMNMVVRTVGGVIGAQIGAVLLASHALAGGVPGEQGFVEAFWVSAVGGLVGAIAAALVLPLRRRTDAVPAGLEPATAGRR